MAKVTVNPGICGLPTTIVATKNDEELIDLQIKTACPNFKYLETELTQVDAFDCCFGKLDESEVFDIVKKNCPHPTCPVIIGILKAVEVAAGLALAKDASIIIEA